MKKFSLLNLFPGSLAYKQKKYVSNVSNDTRVFVKD